MGITNLFTVFLIFLPAFLANASPVVAKNIPGIKNLTRPIYEPWFGKNKTIRGLVVGILTGIITGLVLHALRFSFITHLANYSTLYNLYSSVGRAILIGGVLALGALTGDMVKSYFKRRLGHPPGTMFQPWDGIDYMVGAMIFILPWYTVSIGACVFLLIIGPLLSLLMNTIAYHIGWKECWY